MSISLQVIPISTLQGKKFAYELGDMNYGEWIIYYNNAPFYYFNMFDTMYNEFKNNLAEGAESYLNHKLKQKGKEWSLKPSFVGLKGSNIEQETLELDKMPIAFLK